MSANPLDRDDLEFNALRQAEPTLPASWYIDPDHHAREMAHIWGRAWIYVCRASALSEPMQFQTLEIGPA